MKSINAKAHICHNCQNTFKGKYCNHCGQKLFSRHEKSLLHLLEEGFHFITHFEGKFFTSLRAMVTRPGKLALDYTNGVQKKYFKPLSFFLMLVIIYLLFPVFDGLNLPLKFHTSTQWYADFAQATTQKVTDKYGLTGTELNQKFYSASQTVSKVLLFLMIPILAAWSQLLTVRRKDKLYYDHFIFSTEISSVLVLWGFLILPLVVMFFLKVKKWITGVSQYNDNVVTFTLIFLLLAYIFFATKRFFAFRWYQSLLYAFVYIFFYIIIMAFVYRFLLFWISIKMVH